MTLLYAILGFSLLWRITGRFEEAPKYDDDTT
jgi:hypothetical protein